MDVVMPGMDGGRTLDQIQNLVPGVRVLLSSGYALDGQAQAVMKKGCHGFIQKPFTVHELSVKVRAILDQDDPPADDTRLP
jgi:CheY-like chemotaxis protein